MLTLSALLYLCEGRYLVTSRFPMQWAVLCNFDVLLAPSVNTLLEKNNRFAGDFSRHATQVKSL